MTPDESSVSRHPPCAPTPEPGRDPRRSSDLREALLVAVMVWKIVLSPSSSRFENVKLPAHVAGIGALDLDYPRPRSASRSDAEGPARNWLKSTTRRFSSGLIPTPGFLVQTIQFCECFGGARLSSQETMNCRPGQVLKMKVAVVSRTQIGVVQGSERVAEVAAAAPVYFFIHPRLAMARLAARVKVDSPLTLRAGHILAIEQRLGAPGAG